MRLYKLCPSPPDHSANNNPFLAIIPPTTIINVMNKSELINTLAEMHKHFPLSDVKSAVDVMLNHMTQTLASGERVEIRGFGSFNLHYQAARTGRNPKTGAIVDLPAKYKPHFKPGKELRERVNNSVR